MDEERPAAQAAPGVAPTSGEKTLWACLAAGALFFAPILILAAPAVVTGRQGFGARARQVSPAFRIAAFFGSLYAAYAIYNWVQYFFPGLQPLACAQTDAVDLAKKIVREKIIPIRYPGQYANGMLAIESIRTIKRDAGLECGAKLSIVDLGPAKRVEHFIHYQVQRSDDGKTLYVEVRFDD